MKKFTAIIMALVMVLGLTQCRPDKGNEGDTQNGSKVKVSCVVPMNKGTRSDFTNILSDGRVNWSDGRECIYLAIHGEEPQIIELEGWSDGNPSKLKFEGEVLESLIVSGQEYDIWYFGHSQQLETPYINLADDGSALAGSIANQTGRLDDLGYCHIATTKVIATIEGDEVKLTLKGNFVNQVAIALLDLKNVTELYGDAIVGTEYALEYNGEKYELNITKNNDAAIDVESASGISYVVLFPNDNKETMIKYRVEDRVYAYTFHNYIKSNNIYYRTSSDGETVEFLKWKIIEGEEPEQPQGPETPEDGAPVVKTVAVSNIRATDATCECEFMQGGDAIIVAMGACWNTSGNPTISDSYNYTLASNSVSMGMWPYDFVLSNLEPGTTYYVRAFMTNAKGVNFYGEVIEFTTDEMVLPTIEVEVQNLSSGDRRCQLYIADYGNVPVNDLGICCSTSPNPTIEDRLEGLYGGDYYFYCDCVDWEFGTTYYLRAFVVCGDYIVYGEEVSIGIGDVYSPATGTSNGYGYVDLGLSIKWATCNIGAISPEEYGDYFAWGETTTKDTYETDNCPTFGLNASQFIDGEGNLTSQYDAATANWGGNWRMPTLDELNELKTNCTWTWGIQDGVNGYKVEGPNGNSIFLPAAGNHVGEWFHDAGDCGSYWSSTPCGTNNAYYLSSHIVDYISRHYGHTVRPVQE